MKKVIVLLLIGIGLGLAVIEARLLGRKEGSKE